MPAPSQYDRMVEAAKHSETEPLFHAHTDADGHCWFVDRNQTPPSRERLIAGYTKCPRWLVTENPNATGPGDRWVKVRADFTQAEAEVMADDMLRLHSQNVVPTAPSPSAAAPIAGAAAL